MNDAAKAPELGQVVTVVQGKDRGHDAMIVQLIDSRTVRIADGRKRKFDQAKKKNLIHLQLQDAVSREVADSLEETGRVTNAKLRYALNSFAVTQAVAHEKGESTLWPKKM